MSCLPALETVQLNLYLPFASDLGCLLEALAWCPRLRKLDLSMSDETNEEYEEYEDLYLPFPAPALANLSSLTSLAWSFHKQDPYTLADVVGALVSMTGLAALRFACPKPAVVPAALGHLKGLQRLSLWRMPRCVIEAGCLDLPNLQSLDLFLSTFWDAEVFPGVSALQHLTCIEFTHGMGPVTIDAQFVQLSGLQRLVLSHSSCSPPGLLRLPAHMGALRLGLLHLDLHGRALPRFPLALTQLVALTHLDASGNEFAELPAGITALARLTELMLGRLGYYDDPLQLRNTCPLDVRALGDLSRFPGLRRLSLNFCEVTLCHSVMAAARHASLESLCFRITHPAPECTAAVLQLSQELWRLGRGSMLRSVSPYTQDELRGAQGRVPFQHFMADLEACRLEACGL